MKRSWWKVPVYCLVFGWLSFYFLFRFGFGFASQRLPSGTVVMDQARWLLLKGAVFAVVVALGGFVVFRKMTRRELLLSASVMVALNVVCSLIANRVQGMFSYYWISMGGWYDFVSDLLLKLRVNEWVSAVIQWLLPYLFVLFGKRAPRAEPLPAEPETDSHASPRTGSE